MKKILLHSLAALSLMTITAESTAAVTNPLINGPFGQYSTLPFSSLTPADYKEGVLEGIKLQNREIDALPCG